VWGAAQDKVRGWEASGQIGVVRQEIPTVKEAVEKHVADAEARNLKPESVKKVRDVVERRLLDYCSRESYPLLKQLDVDAVREFRNELVKDYSANSARKRLEYVRAFFRFCQQSGWIASDPSGLVKSPRGQGPRPYLSRRRKSMRCSPRQNRSTRRADSRTETVGGFAPWFCSCGIPAFGFRTPQSSNAHGYPTTSCFSTRKKPARRSSAQA
jgi:hypothetical protein